MNNIVEYIKGSYYEFTHNVDFPSWKDLQSSTIVVFVATLLLAAFLFGVDEVFSTLMDNVYTYLRKLFN